MAANVGILMLLAGCRKDDAEPENPFDDWGPYKSCTRDVVYMEYDESDPDAAPSPSRETITVFTAQGGALQEDEYVDESDGSHTLDWSTVWSYDETTHAPLGYEIYNMWYAKVPTLYVRETYSYRTDGLLAWYSGTAPNWWLEVFTVTRDELDRIVRVDTDRAPTDAKGSGDVDGVPDKTEVWIYDGDQELPGEVKKYWGGIADDEYLQSSTRYTIENDVIVRTELVAPSGDVYEVHDYTYDDDDHLLTDVRDGGWETFTLTWDGDFLVLETHEVAWKELSDVRTDWTGAATYDCEDK